MNDNANKRRILPSRRACKFYMEPNVNHGINTDPSGVDYFTSIVFDVKNDIFKQLDIFDQMKHYHLFGKSHRYPSQFEVAMTMLKIAHKNKWGDGGHGASILRGPVSDTFRNQQIPHELFEWELTKRHSFMSSHDIWMENKKANMRNEPPPGYHLCSIILPKFKCNGEGLSNHCGYDCLYCDQHCQVDTPKDDCIGRGFGVYSCHCGFNCIYCDDKYPDDFDSEYAYGSELGLQSRYPSSYMNN